MKTALVTGHEGFIGQNLINELKGMPVVTMGMEKEMVRTSLEFEALETQIYGSDVIFHNGAISDTTNDDYHEMLYYNYHFTKILVDLAKKHGKKVIYASSASVYGNGGSKDVPNNIYAWSKMLGEEYGRLVYPEGFTALRYFNVYGPHEEHKGKMSSIGFQAWEHKEHNMRKHFELFPNNPTRDFIYVKDVISANMRAIDAPAGVYEVGTGESRSFEDFLDNMDNIVYNHVGEDKIPSWYQFFTKANPDNWLPDWEPEYTLEKGCEDYLKYLNEKK